jgi:hypothetical protein
VRPIKIKTRYTFLKKHNRLLTFVGALVVFITFIVKDAVREELKSTIDAEQWAETMFLNSSRYDDNDHGLDEVEGKLDILIEAVRPNKKAANEKEERDCH